MSKLNIFLICIVCLIVGLLSGCSMCKKNKSNHIMVIYDYNTQVEYTLPSDSLMRLDCNAKYIYIYKK